MLYNEIKILEILFNHITTPKTISDISRLLKQKYPQTHRSIIRLEKEGLIIIEKIGKSKVIKLDFDNFHPEYALVELTKLKRFLKNKEIYLITEKLSKMNKPFVCLLFGSYAQGKQKKDSDLDLLFIIHEEYDSTKFERLIKNQLISSNVDISIIKEDNLFEMWSKKELNVANEILKKHVVLTGAEYFINLMRKKNVGR